MLLERAHTEILHIEETYWWHTTFSEHSVLDADMIAIREGKEKSKEDDKKKATAKAIDTHHIIRDSYVVLKNHQ